MGGRKTQQMPTATLHVLRGNKIDWVKLSSRYLYSAEKGESKRLVEPPYSYSERKKIPFSFILKSSFEKQLFKLSELSPISYMKGLLGSSCVRALHSSAQWPPASHLCRMGWHQRVRRRKRLAHPLVACSGLRVPVAAIILSGAEGSLMVQMSIEN